MRHEMFLILAVLAESPAEASEILDRVERAGGPAAAPTVPTLYRRLRDALDRGWVEGTDVGGSSTRGRVGQRYVLTPSGRRAVRAEAVRWRSFADLVLDPERAG